jgi:hypothetical protein
MVGRFIICIYLQISLGRSNQGERSGWGMWHARERRGKCTEFWWESTKGADHLEDQGVDGRMGLEWILGTLAWVGGGGVEWIHLAKVRD